MRCHEARNHASDYVDLMLDDETRDRVADHLGGCPECRGHVDGLRAVVASLREIRPPAAPSDLFERTLVALDREAEPETSIITRRHFRLRPRYAGNLVETARQVLLDYEFKLIAYSVGLVCSFVLFGGLLASMRPFLSLSPFVSPSQRTIWMSPGEARVLGSFASVHSLPRIASASAVPVVASDVEGIDNLVVIAEIGADGRGSIVQVLSAPPPDAYAVGRLAVAMNQPSAFEPAYATSGRPIPSRVVIFVERVDVLG